MDCLKSKDPSGIWRVVDMLGSKVRVKSLPVSNFFSTFDSERLYTISDIKFHVSKDGKTITGIRLKELPEKIFTWRDLEIVSVNIKYPAICGKIKAGVTLVGNHEC